MSKPFVFVLLAGLAAGQNPTPTPTPAPGLTPRPTGLPEPLPVDVPNPLPTSEPWANPYATPVPLPTPEATVPEATVTPAPEPDATTDNTGWAESPTPGVGFSRRICARFGTIVQVVQDALQNGVCSQQVMSRVVAIAHYNMDGRSATEASSHCAGGEARSMALASACDDVHIRAELPAPLPDPFARQLLFATTESCRTLVDGLQPNICAMAGSVDPYAVGADLLGPVQGEANELTLERMCLSVALSAAVNRTINTQITQLCRSPGYP